MLSFLFLRIFCAAFVALFVGYLIASNLKLRERIKQMSASLVRLQAAAHAAEQKIADLQAALVAAQAAAGTPDADLDAVSSGLEAAVSPTQPAPAP